MPVTILIDCVNKGFRQLSEQCGVVLQLCCSSGARTWALPYLLYVLCQPFLCLVRVLRCSCMVKVQAVELLRRISSCMRVQLLLVLLVNKVAAAEC